MGMSVGAGNNTQVSDPNIVPLIDVLLLLIIIFMVLTPKIPTGLPTLIPQPAPKSNAQPEPSTIVVQVMPGNKVMINEQQSDWDTLGTRLSDIFKERANKVAFVKGDGDVSFQRVARAIDIMKGAGIEHVGLITPAVTTEE